MNRDLLLPRRLWIVTTIILIGVAICPVAYSKGYRLAGPYRLAGVGEEELRRFLDNAATSECLGAKLASDCIDEYERRPNGGIYSTTPESKRGIRDIHLAVLGRLEKWWLEEGKSYSQSTFVAWGLKAVPVRYDADRRRLYLEVALEGTCQCTLRGIAAEATTGISNVKNGLKFGAYATNVSIQDARAWNTDPDTIPLRLGIIFELQGSVYRNPELGFAVIRGCPIRIRGIEVFVTDAGGHIVNFRGPLGRFSLPDLKTLN